MSKFQIGKIFRHSRSMDIDFSILRFVSEDELGTRLYGAWVSKETRRFISFDEILIKPEQYPNWKEVKR